MIVELGLAFTKFILNGNDLVVSCTPPVCGSIIHTFAFFSPWLLQQHLKCRIRKEEEELERWRKEREQAKKARQAERARKGEIQGQTSLPIDENQKQLSSEQVAEVDGDKDDGKQVETRAPSETPPTSTDQQANHQVDIIQRNRFQLGLSYSIALNNTWRSRAESILGVLHGW